MMLSVSTHVQAAVISSGSSFGVIGLIIAAGIVWFLVALWWKTRK